MWHHPKSPRLLQNRDSAVYNLPEPIVLPHEVLEMASEYAIKESRSGRGLSCHFEVRRTGFLSRASLRLPIFWKTVRLCWRARPVTVRTLSVSASSSSPRIFAVLRGFSIAVLRSFSIAVLRSLSSQSVFLHGLVLVERRILRQVAHRVAWAP